VPGKRRSKRAPERFGRAGKGPGEEECRGGEWHLERESDEKGRLERRRERELTRGGESLEMLLQHEGERRDEHERPDRRSGARAAAKGRDRVAEERGGEEREAAGEEEREVGEICVTGALEELAPDSRIGLDDPVRQQVRGSRSGCRKRKRRDPG
jgi:hypothetical protein